MPTRARDRLLQAADELFYEEGINGVGLERLLSHSGVGRASLYRHFDGKDDLVSAVLQRRDEHWRRWLRERVEARGGAPLAVFDALAEGAEDSSFRGCAFINAMAEKAKEPGSTVHRLAVEHKRKVADYVRGLIADAGHAGAPELAEQFTLLMDGAVVTAMSERSVEPFRRARQMAQRLLS
ncbi:TetR family transcriptional regulator [Streptomyces sp. CSDS2]|uniref:TetR/AcrR family transcriptional regulator n=1 Tax=Streptomyces sp. CSDS2 TaxID=3055051 RepID=UPI0025AFF6F6|nr:TetR/AcrR family transcriptional regulator [Streptomyces sp. CSDS2]MDN3260230.1 TetR family transcriptional regulator [Streptomyces sp. CSDS2]